MHAPCAALDKSLSCCYVVVVLVIVIVVVVVVVVFVVVVAVVPWKICIKAIGDLAQQCFPHDALPKWTYNSTHKLCSKLIA